MKLYNRLLMEGVFLFWDDDNECDYYLINTYINQLDKKIKIKEEKIDGNTHCYSIDKIGNGEYFFELSSYKNDKVLDKVDKTVNLSSLSAQISELYQKLEQLEKINNELQQVSALVTYIRWKMD